MSLISGLTIGLPAFILALEPNYNKIKTSFFINILSNSIPGGLTTVINILMLIGITSLFKISPAQTSTMAVIITGYTALLLIYRISKPFNFLRKALLATLSTIFLLVLITTSGRSVFSLAILTPNSLLILVLLTYLSTKLFGIFNQLLVILIKKKNSWFI
ncbi:MAG: hypothetical protein RSA10_02285 [Bacilli bacterium]